MGVPLRGFSQAEAPVLRAKPYIVSPVALLQVCYVASPLERLNSGVQKFMFISSCLLRGESSMLLSVSSQQ